VLLNHSFVYYISLYFPRSLGEWTCGSVFIRSRMGKVADSIGQLEELLVGCSMDLGYPSC
jgi:hypothetical protein